MLKKFLNEEEIKELKIIIVTALIVFMFGYCIGGLFLENEPKKSEPTIYAFEEFKGLPFEMEGAEVKESFAILENENSEAYAEVYVKGNSEDLTITFDKNLCEEYYTMNEDGTGVNYFTTIRLYLYFGDRTFEEHSTYQIDDEGNITFYDFPEKVAKIFLIAKDTIVAHEFFDSSEDENDFGRYEKIRKIYINFD